MTTNWSRRRLLHLGLTGLSGIAASQLAGCKIRGESATEHHHHLVLGTEPGTAPAPAAHAAPTGLDYVVRRGDTLSSISRRSGVPVRSIIDTNRLDSNVIKPGQHLWLPGTEAMHLDPLAQERADKLAQVDAAALQHYGYVLVPRGKWTRQKVGRNHRKMGRITRLTVHHTGEHAGMRGLADVEIIKRIERYHREGRNWSSIGYHFLIGRDGRVYEGRPDHIQGAHVSHHNSNNLGISCIGDFQQKLPTARQLGALAAFLDDKRRQYGVARKRVYGHRDLGTTICPGKQLYGWLKTWRRG